MGWSRDDLGKLRKPGASVENPHGQTTMKYEHVISTLGDANPGLPFPVYALENLVAPWVAHRGRGPWAGGGDAVGRAGP